MVGEAHVLRPSPGHATPTRSAVVGQRKTASMIFRHVRGVPAGQPSARPRVRPSRMALAALPEAVPKSTNASAASASGIANRLQAAPVRFVRASRSLQAEHPCRAASSARSRAILEIPRTPAAVSHRVPQINSARQLHCSESASRIASVPLDRVGRARRARRHRTARADLRAAMTPSATRRAQRVATTVRRSTQRVSQRQSSRSR